MQRVDDGLGILDAASGPSEQVEPLVKIELHRRRSEAKSAHGRRRPDHLAEEAGEDLAGSLLGLLVVLFDDATALVRLIDDDEIEGAEPEPEDLLGDCLAVVGPKTVHVYVAVELTVVLRDLEVRESLELGAQFAKSILRGALDHVLGDVLDPVPCRPPFGGVLRVHVQGQVLVESAFAGSAVEAHCLGRQHQLHQRRQRRPPGVRVGAHLRHPEIVGEQ